MGFNLPVLNRRRRPGGFSPVFLFSSGSQGVWYEPSDLTTMFQDRAGTTPVTTPGQTVGLRLDKSKGLTLGPELAKNGAFDTDTDWNKETGWSISSGSATKAPGVAGSLYQSAAAMVQGRAYQITFTVSGYSAGTLTPFCRGTAGAGVTANGTYTQRLVAGAVSAYAINFFAGATFVGSIDNISVKELPGNHAVAPTDAARPTYGIEPWSGRRNLLLATDTMATQSLTVTAVAHTLAFTGTGTVILAGASIAGPLVGTGASNRVSLTFTPIAASLTLTVVGSVTLAQLELGSTATAYQRVGTAFDVTEAGVPTVHYVQYDGTDDSFSTSSIDFSATDKMSVFAGVRKLSDAVNQAIICESGPDSGSTAGTFAVQCSPSTGPTYRFELYGSSRGVRDTTGSTYAAPNTSVITSIMDISGTSIATELMPRINGVVPSLSNVLSPSGTGNFGNYSMFFGRRNNALAAFNGRDYGIIIVGKTASATEIAATEAWLAARTSGVTL